MRNNKGQTAVEYVLMVAIVAVIVLKIASLLKVYLSGNPEDCTPQSKGLHCFIHGQLTQMRKEGFKTFRIMK